MTPEIRFVFDDAELIAAPGQSIAAALIAAGRRSWRTTRVGGEARGAFCGIGVCFDCLVMVNGRPNQRACLTEVRPGDRVERQEGTGREHLTG
ncbi:(2Fe-2S)-binding protein [Pseudonocardia alaniniphila]|uniref:(2Fe-2S)-binding protein n=1 Tax=Pseudonocardia alaniniphila TaxID=75291 RepID=A0ABS9TSI9_9PSEU|nr:(2Fe-2S)-binding protein [Pseudonocardia alaniniphila]MCH6171525.1 (2Fe-2S)-binding protein [Pseudonocardia alaniniphila]